MLKLWPALLLLGCGQSVFSTRFFTSEGTVSSSGGGLGQWSAHPEACTRDTFLGPAEGLPVADPSRSLVTFLWEDLTNGKPRPDLYRRFGPDAPRRLEIASSRKGYTATLETMKVSQGVRLDSANCRIFSVITHEGAAAEPHGRPLLNGELKMDCTVQHAQQDVTASQTEAAPTADPLPSHITADVKFSRCGF